MESEGGTHNLCNNTHFQDEIDILVSSLKNKISIKLSIYALID